jgi:uncharacterized protein YeeX (DUF496 family)
MKVEQSDLISKLTQAAEKIIPHEEAVYFATETLEAYIRKSPRTNPLKSSIDDLETSLKNKDKKIKYVVDLPSYIAIDFQGHGPLTYLKKIHDELGTRADTNGIVMAAFTNSQSMHTLHT